MDKNLAMIRHERSKKDFPKLQLDDDEYVELAFGRARNGLLLAWAGIGAIIALVLLVLLLLLVSEIVADDVSVGFLLSTVCMLAIVAIVAGWAVTVVDRSNKLFFTNKRMIQIVANFPLFESERSVNLSGIHKVQFTQDSFIERLLGIGTLKFSTHEKNVMMLEDEAPKPAVTLFRDNSGNVYTFPKVEVSPKQIEQMNEIISNAPKMGHKFSEDITELNHDI